ncbi:hypothetical protein QFC21_006692 [Naganishia friedmannii]|uniref:Uncharacterized protein n=1 Tax=Naganishia friedmannii TaxID=89922 RepID=A0ACC2V2C9_9TREE|nr:hypothetical protein QFC21_006692 [Naganishia friedmannii]
MCVQTYHDVKGDCASFIRDSVVGRMQLVKFLGISYASSYNDMQLNDLLEDINDQGSWNWNLYKMAQQQYLAIVANTNTSHTLEQSLFREPASGKADTGGCDLNARVHSGQNGSLDGSTAPPLTASHELTHGPRTNQITAVFNALSEAEQPSDERLVIKDPEDIGRWAFNSAHTVQRKQHVQTPRPMFRFQVTDLMQRLTGWYGQATQRSKDGMMVLPETLESFLTCAVGSQKSWDGRFSDFMLNQKEREDLLKAILRNEYIQKAWVKFGRTVRGLNATLICEAEEKEIVPQSGPQHVHEQAESRAAVM